MKKTETGAHPVVNKRLVLARSTVRDLRVATGLQAGGTASTCTHVTTGDTTAC